MTPATISPMNYPYPHSRILVFARAPRPGHCKTRLIPALGAEGAARLHHQLVHHTLATATHAALAPVELWCADDPAADFYQHCRQRFQVKLRQQAGDDLGERMNHALNQTLIHRQSALLIGCDCPSFTREILAEALAALQNRRCVLGPADDGGYVLVGLNQATPNIFLKMQWGHPAVLDDTRQRLRQENIHWHELGVQHDIDHPHDLRHLPEYISQQPVEIEY